MHSAPAEPQTESRFRPPPPPAGYLVTTLATSGPPHDCSYEEQHGSAVRPGVNWGHRTRRPKWVRLVVLRADG